MGLGFAAIRDLNSYLKYETNNNPLTVPGGLIADYIYGKSQSARFIRDYLKLGFNQDESGRKVFDGMIPDAAGGVADFSIIASVYPVEQIIITKGTTFLLISHHSVIL